MRKILLGCTLVAVGLLLGIQMANAEEDRSGPPISRLVPIPSEYDTTKGELVKTDNVIFLLTKDYYQRDIYKLSTSPKVKYAVKEYKEVSRVEWIPAGWYEVQPLTPEAPKPSYEWKYATHK